MLRRKLLYPCFFGLLLFAIMNTLSCSGSGGGGNDSSTPLVSDAIKNVNTADTITDAEIELDSSGKKIAITKMMIVFKPTATAQQLDELLASLNATVTMSLAGTRSVVVRIPDPGSLDAYQAIVDSVESKPYIDFVWQGEISKPLELPDNFADDPPDSAELFYVDHQIAVGGPAAWNLRDAIKSVPKVLIVDWFGQGSPTNDTINLIHNGTFLDLPIGDDHGYHVLGIIAGTFGQHKITGIYPSTIDLFVIDNMNPTDIPTEMLLIIEKLSSISGKVVVNTSIGYKCDGAGGNCIDLAKADQRALLWIEYIRMFGLEDQALFVTAAGNVEDPPGINIRDAKTSYYTSSGALLGGLTDSEESPVLSLSNTLVVENGLAWDIVDDGLTGPLCLSEWSFVGGNIMGVGEYVWSFVDASGTVGVMSGTSMATPQVAGVAAYLWAIEPNLTPQQIVNILIKTGTEMTPTAYFGCSNWATPAPIIDAYAALLSLDAAAAPTPSNSPVRLALLDVNGDDKFDETDLTAFVLRYFGSLDATEMIQPTDKEYGRYDLSGEGWVGAHYNNTFDLDRSGSEQYGQATFGDATFVIDDLTVTYDEQSVTDMDIVCYYAYSDLYTGDPTERQNLLEGKCLDNEEGPCDDWWPPISGPEVVEYNGLEWQRCDPWVQTAYDWWQSKTYCENLVLNNHSDWRLPTKDELKGLIVCSNGTPTPLNDFPDEPYTCGEPGTYDYPAIDPQFAGMRLNYGYWTSTERVDGDVTYMWTVDLGDGRSWSDTKPAVPQHFKCVR